ncbi:MAG: hypothetical protein GY832_28945 [Chloroflexi bacterium]|nr:hypothetical protein [Chloroflexota bacterium]
MKTLEMEGYETQAVVTAHLEYGDETDYLEMGSILGHVRAITSAMLLKTHRKQDSGIKIDGHSTHLERNGHYRVFTFKAPSRKKYGITTKVAILHEKFTSLAKVEDAFYILLPPDHDATRPPNDFFERLRLAIDVPLSSEWAEWLWQKAQEIGHGYYGQSLITIRRDFNATSATIYTDTAKWLELVRDHLGLKCIVHRTSTGYISDDETWELRKLGSYNWTIFHNGERVTVVKEEPDKPKKTIPYGAPNLDAALEHAKNELGIVLTLEGN